MLPVKRIAIITVKTPFVLYETAVTILDRLMRLTKDCAHTMSFMMIAGFLDPSTNWMPCLIFIFIPQSFDTHLRVNGSLVG
jgi:hypothetical protein